MYSPAKLPAISFATLINASASANLFGAKSALGPTIFKVLSITADNVYSPAPSLIISPFCAAWIAASNDSYSLPAPTSNTLPKKISPAFFHVATNTKLPVVSSVIPAKSWPSNFQPANS